MAEKGDAEKQEQIRKQFEENINKVKEAIGRDNPNQEEVFDSTNFNYVKDVWLKDFTDVKKMSKRDAIREKQNKDEQKKRNRKKGKKGKKKRIKKLKEDEDLIKDFVQKYYNSYINRLNKEKNVANKKTKKRQKTEPDPLMFSFIEMINENLTQEEVNRMLTFHKQAMTLETFIGHVLEEYIFETAREYNWAFCWGECIKSVDFCKNDGTLLQVKNSTSSENSSSSQVRNGTRIIPWFRRNSKTGDTYWPKLNDILGIAKKEDLLDEEKFIEFAKKIFDKNKAILINVL